MNLIRLRNLQISYKGKSNTHFHIKDHEMQLFTFNELSVNLNDLN